ncbi:hypothetical protein [Clostridium sp. CF012]|uniref:hypothetical protein n=1 Tax=Clostridium sp. CF012 TaxID=2843319 RepID=UPI00209B661E|nr:hypothetical protein [Clostridium sp. CF012]
MQVPVLPEEMPELNKTSKNEEFETFNNGIFNLLGSVGLVTFNLTRFLPQFGGKYSWARSKDDPYLLINLWIKAMHNKVPLRCVMMRGNKHGKPEILNWLVSVEAMTWHEDRLHDVQYSVDFKEYRVIK